MQQRTQVEAAPALTGAIGSPEALYLETQAQGTSVALSVKVISPHPEIDPSIELLTQWECCFFLSLCPITAPLTQLEHSLSQINKILERKKKRNETKPRLLFFFSLLFPILSAEPM